MVKSLTYNKTYFVLFILLLIIEALIAYFLKSGFIRHTFGDYLVVILLYCFIKSFVKAKTFTVATFVLIIAYVIEVLQYFNLLAYLNLENSTIAKLILGSTYHFEDIIAYTLGVLTILLIEKERII
ncbi:DUF2809 domain-containing protein [Pontimicrobium sp. IMCC45349]|uniref:ribosomal maturation YjgA family protein n=1 Tax=Pontimicrobium sp. IMCC45349 TaxID=3391574 RepID=UPI0039A26282